MYLCTYLHICINLGIQNKELLYRHTRYVYYMISLLYILYVCVLTIYSICHLIYTLIAICKCAGLYAELQARAKWNFSKFMRVSKQFRGSQRSRGENAHPPLCSPVCISTVTLTFYVPTYVNTYVLSVMGSAYTLDMPYVV